MVFSSIVFLFYFLPVFLTAYYAVPGTTTKNVVLLLSSLIFYLWGEPWFLSVLIVVMVLNYLVAILIDTAGPKARMRFTVFGIGTNLIVLGVFKYLDFFVGNINAVAGRPMRALAGTRAD